MFLGSAVRNHFAPTPSLCLVLGIAGIAGCGAVPEKSSEASTTEHNQQALLSCPAAKGAPSGYSPSDLRQAYGLPDSGGRHLTVAIVGAGDYPGAECALQTFRTGYGLPECSSANGCFRKIDKFGAPVPQINNLGTCSAKSRGEFDIDMDMVSAACPDCNITLLELPANFSPTNGDTVAMALGAAYTAGASILSNSTGSFGIVDPAYDYSLVIPGVSLVDAAGETKDGSAGYRVNGAVGSTYIISVGATILSPDLNNPQDPRGWTESAWYLSVSGCSGYGFPALPAQVSLNGDICSGKRALCDISTAGATDPKTHKSPSVYFSSTGWSSSNGTSVSAPFVAGALGVTGNAGMTPNNLYTQAYLNPAAFNDVTQGNNGTCGVSSLCTAGSGWDGPTGLGTPNGWQLVHSNSSQNGRIAAISRFPDATEYNVFWIGNDGSVNRTYRSSGTYWNDIVAPLNSAPPLGHLTAVSRNSQTMEVFWIGQDGHVWEAHHVEGSSWSQPNNPTPNLYAATTGGITSVSRTASSSDVFYAGSDGALHQMSCSQLGSCQGASFVLGGSATSISTMGSALAAVARSPGLLDVLFIGPDGSVKDMYTVDNGLSFPVYTFGGPGSASHASTVTGLSRWPGSAEFYFVTPSGALVGLMLTPGSGAWAWTQPVASGVRASGSLAAVARDGHDTDLLYIATDGSINDVRYTDGIGWSSSSNVMYSGVVAPNGIFAAAPIMAGLVRITYAYLDQSMVSQDWSRAYNYAWSGNYSIGVPAGSIASIPTYPLNRVYNPANDLLGTQCITTKRALGNMTSRCAVMPDTCGNLYCIAY
jgi:hypothetical protein